MIGTKKPTSFLFDLRKNGFCIFVSVENYELRMKKKFFILFLMKKRSRKKFLTSFFSKKVAYKTLVLYTKPWTLYLVSVLRNKGRKMKNSFQKNHEAEFLLKIFFDEKVAKDSTQLLARTKVFHISFQF